MKKKVQPWSWNLDGSIPTVVFNLKRKWVESDKWIFFRIFPLIVCILRSIRFYIYVPLKKFFIAFIKNFLFYLSFICFYWFLSILCINIVFRWWHLTILRCSTHFRLCLFIFFLLIWLLRYIFLWHVLQFLWEVLRMGRNFRGLTLCNTKHHQKSRYFKIQETREKIRKCRMP